MLPKQPGTYVLSMRLSSGRTISVGRLGEFRFVAGWYAYVGSARGPGGLAARVSRHLRESKVYHWHIDYVRAHAEPVMVWYTVGTVKRECSWASVLSELPGASLPASGFGASDCQCLGHLVHFPARPELRDFARLADSPISESTISA
jgi:Uri superfamily endonuclease